MHVSCTTMVGVKLYEESIYLNFQVVSTQVSITQIGTSMYIPMLGTLHIRSPFKWRVATPSF